MSSEPLKRVRFFSGQLLTAEDFQAEQDYHLEKHRRHNRTVHGFGIVTGLKAAIREHTITVKQGTALDCMGNEIVVCEAQSVPLPGDGKLRFLVLEYAEALTDPVPTPGAGADSEASRILEGFRLKLVEEDPFASHKKKPCEQLHAVTLAKLKCLHSRWTIDRNYRPARIRRG